MLIVLMHHGNAGRETHVAKRNLDGTYMQFSLLEVVSTQPLRHWTVPLAS